MGEMTCTMGRRRDGMSYKSLTVPVDTDCEELESNYMAFVNEFDGE